MEDVNNINLVENNITNIGIRTASTVSSVLIGQLFTLLLGVVLLIGLARLLGPANYGVYTFAISFAGVFAALGDFGVSTAITKFVSQHKHHNSQKELQSALSAGLVMVLILGTSFAIAAFLLSGFAARTIFHDIAITPILELASLTVFAAMINGALDGSLIGIGKGRQIFVAAMVQTVFQFVISIGLVFIGFGAAAPVTGLIFGYLAGACVALFYIHSVDKIRVSLCPSIKDIKRLLSFSLPVALSSLFVNILPDIAVLAIGSYGIPILVGNFGIAVKIYTFLNGIAVSIVFSLLPTFTATITDKRIAGRIGVMYNYAVYFAFLFLVPAILFMVFMAKQVSYTVFGGSYALAPEYIVIIGLGFVIWILGIYASAVLVSANKVWDVLKFNLFVDAIVLILLPFVSGYQNGLGIVIDIFLFAPLLYDIIFYFGLKRHFKIRVDAKKLGRVFLADLVTMFVILALLGMVRIDYISSLVLGFAALLILYPPLVAFIGGFNRGDVRVIETTTKKIPVVGAVMNLFAAYASLAMH